MSREIISDVRRTTQHVASAIAIVTRAIAIVTRAIVIVRRANAIVTRAMSIRLGQEPLSRAQSSLFGDKLALSKEK